MVGWLARLWEIANCCDAQLRTFCAMGFAIHQKSQPSTCSSLKMIPLRTSSSEIMAQAFLKTRLHEYLIHSSGLKRRVMRRAEGRGWDYPSQNGPFKCTMAG